MEHEDNGDTSLKRWKREWRNLKNQNHSDNIIVEISQSN